MLKAPTSGGAPLTLAPVTRSRGATWTDDGEIIIASGPDQGLSRVAATGGSLTPLTTLDASKGELTHRWPFYAGHNVVIFTSHVSTSGTFDVANIEALNLKTNTRKIVLRGGSYARYVPSGHLIYVNKNVVYAVPFDLDKMETTGSSSPVIQGVSYAVQEGSSQFAVSQNGFAVYRSGQGSEQTFPAQLVDRSGQANALWEGRRTYGEVHLSPDGTKASAQLFADGDWDLWVYDRVRKVPTRLTFAPGMDGPGIWSPDSKYIANSSAQGGSANIYRRRADGSGEPERVTTAKVTQYVSSWSSDGKYLMYNEQTNGTDIMIVPLDGDRKPRVFLSTPFNESEGTFSPDGRWVAYQSDESGSREVYVRPITGAGKWQISDHGGGYPRWSGDGRQLLYRDNQGIVVVPISTSGDSLQAGRPEHALTGAFRGGIGGMTIGGLINPDYDVSRDGKQFLVYPVDDKASTKAEHVTVLLNWFTELKRLLPSKK